MRGTSADPGAVSRPRFVVIEDGTPEQIERVCRELRARKLAVVRAVDQARPGIVIACEVSDAASAQAAVLAALAGAHLVVTASAPREVTDMLCEDLRRLGDLDHRVGERTEQHPAVRLSDTERALLERLLAGDSLGQAARALHLSRRTADRRLAAVRQALGAATTAEALAIAVRLGLRPPRT